jgi:hypothetical protein
LRFGFSTYRDKVEDYAEKMTFLIPAEETMDWNAVLERSKIADVMEDLASQRSELKVFVSGQRESFTSSVLKFDRRKALSRRRKGAELIIEKVFPSRGNELIQASAELVLEFSLRENRYRCSVRYAGISSEHPYFGYMLSLPEFIEIKERRREERFTYETPDFVTVEFSLGQGSGQEKVYELNVLNCSLHGLGLLITESDFDLVERLRPGDKLAGMTLYAESSMIRVEGIVRHVTKMTGGPHPGCYVLGIESQEIIENCQSFQS